MMPEEEQVHVLSRVDILEPFSDEELRELLRRNPDTYLKQERSSIAQRM